MSNFVKQTVSQLTFKIDISHPGCLKKTFVGVFLLLKSTKLPFAKKKLLLDATTNFLGATWRPSKPLKAVKNAFGNKNLVTGFEWPTAASRWPVTKAYMSEVRRDGVSFQFSINVCSVFFFTSWDSYGFVMFSMVYLEPTKEGSLYWDVL